MGVDFTMRMCLALGVPQATLESMACAWFNDGKGGFTLQLPSATIDSIVDEGSVTYRGITATIAYTAKHTSEYGKLHPRKLSTEEFETFKEGFLSKLKAIGSALPAPPSRPSFLTEASTHALKQQNVIIPQPDSDQARFYSRLTTREWSSDTGLTRAQPLGQLGRRGKGGLQNGRQPRLRRPSQGTEVGTRTDGHRCKGKGETPRPPPPSALYVIRMGHLLTVASCGNCSLSTMTCYHCNAQFTSECPCGALFDLEGGVADWPSNRLIREPPPPGRPQIWAPVQSVVPELIVVWVGVGRKIQGSRRDNLSEMTGYCAR